MESKQLWQSKRFWAGVIALITGVSMIATGEKTVAELIPEIATTVFGLIQTLLGLYTNTPVALGRKVLGKKY